MPDRRPNICCGCGRFGFSSKRRESCNELLTPHRPDQSAKVAQRQPNRDSQPRSSVFPPLCSIAGRASAVLGERKYWRSNNSEVSSAQASLPVSRVQPHSLPRELSERLLIKTLELRYDTGWGQSRKLPPLQANDSRTLISSSSSSHMVFFKKKI